jgi:hypothetical protein
VFPDWKQAKRRASSWFAEVTAWLPARIAVATFFVLLHLSLFSRAGHQRLGMPFNSYPSEAPYFSNPDATPFEVPRQPHRWSRLIVSRFDAQHHIATAERGISACPEHGDGGAYLNCGLGWLPAWGSVGGLVSQTTTMASDKALLMLAILAALALNLLWTSAVIVERLGRGPAWAALFAFNAFPAAFYLVTPYSESATLALGLAGFVALAKDRWWLAAALVGASTALQPSSAAFALAMGAALAVMAAQKRSGDQANWWRPLLALPLCVWGQVVTIVALQIFVGDGGAYLRARHAFGVTYEWGRLLHGAYYMKGLAGQDMDGAMLLAVVAIIAFSAREVMKRMSVAEATYLAVASGVALVLSVVTPVHYWGQTRLLMSCLLAFLGLGIIAKRSLVLFALWIVLSFAFYWHVDLCDYVTQGKISACPNLGRVELSLPLDR